MSFATPITRMRTPMDIIKGEIKEPQFPTDSFWNRTTRQLSESTDEIVAETVEEPVVHTVNSIFDQAMTEGATDIHIDVQEEMMRIRFRTDGLLRDVLELPVTMHASLISRIKVMAGLDIAKRKVPQDGRIQYASKDKTVDLRVSTIPTLYGEKCTIRLLDKHQMLLGLEDLGFCRDAMAQYRTLTQNTGGMILLTGPTGAGKTTTLYATVKSLNRGERNIVTIEDPIEYVLPGVNQVQVCPKAGLDFANGLRSILRQDPDIILIGEIRDGETAHIAVQAAITGHLVLSTLHTGDAAEAIGRLLDMGVEPFQVASAVKGVVAQRLVRKICSRCKTEYIPAKGSEEQEFLSKEFGIKAALSKGKGCKYCNFTGYRPHNYSRGYACQFPIARIDHGEGKCGRDPQDRHRQRDGKPTNSRDS
ncbi:type II/IV secretion system protein [Heliobacillus mobilis]|uniref:Type II/IV secretion system protein n=1 Tax=Heliobacterium mobile TaxID=28064 RepID=A0A6I3SKF9_HELMO|nr:GspE/PulE family protein [Heliobacterium mobile]MTV49360.1 type II/IV secretion system protein [Heliobacterium mobile]